MSFTIDPGNYSGPSGSSRRPDVRDGEKVLWLCGIKMGMTMGGSPKLECCYVVVHDPDGGNDVKGLVWETFPLTQAAAWKLQQVSQAIGQKTSWEADNEEEAWRVLGKRPVIAHVVSQPKRNGEGKVARVKRFKMYSEDPSDEMEKIVTDAEDWHTKWKNKGSSSSGFSSTSADDIPF